MPPIPAKRRGGGRQPLSAGSGRGGRTGDRGGGRSGHGGRGLIHRLPPRPAGVAGKTDISNNPNLECASDSEESSEDLLGRNNTCDHDDSSNLVGKSKLFTVILLYFVGSLLL